MVFCGWLPSSAEPTTRLSEVLCSSEVDNSRCGKCREHLVIISAFLSIMCASGYTVVTDPVAPRVKVVGEGPQSGAVGIKVSGTPLQGFTVSVLREIVAA